MKKGQVRLACRCTKGCIMYAVVTRWKSRCDGPRPALNAKWFDEAAA